MIETARRLLYRTDRRAFVTLALLVLAGYLAVYGGSFLLGRPAQSDQIHLAYLADAFLHGRLDVTPDEGSRLTELVPRDGKLFVVYPPVPAVILMPVVAIFGPRIPTGLISILFVALAIAFLYLWLRRLEIDAERAWWVSFLFAFGTSLWYLGVKGSSWSICHVTGIAFLAMALVETETGRRGIVAGALLGAAFLCRLPLLLSTPFVGLLLVRKGERRIRTVALFLAAVAACYALNMLYNWLRFDSVSNVAYNMIPGVLDEPWYSKGILHWSYLPRNIYAIFFQPPVLLEEFPYLVPSAFGLSLFFTSPALLLMFLAPGDRRTWFFAVAALVCLLPALLHGYPGATQFGYRYSLDAFPFLAALTARGMRRGVTARVLFLIVLSCLIGVWGLVFIRIIAVQWPYDVFSYGPYGSTGG